MKVENPGSFLDHFLRQTRIHHVQLSGMADMKANMMLTVASVVLTFTVGYLADPAFQWAALTLIAFCFASIVAAIYSVMPRVPLPSKNGARHDMKDPNYNPLFFGTFIHMTLEEYNEVMEHAVNDPSEAVELMVREIYTLGCFLAYRKYRYLRWAYLLFLSGLLIAGLVQALCVLLLNLGIEPWHIHLVPASPAGG
jgi:hypothetical protein